MKDRNLSIDILKCIAAILITNSHMDTLYVNSAFATGGAIGDALFFFCLGFVLFLKPMGRFDNWYKKRVNRIYPTVFAWAILTALFFEDKDTILDIIYGGGAWFITCVMIYYIPLYIINQYMMKRLSLVVILISIIVVTWFILMDRPIDYNMYGATYFKWGFFFLFVLFGAILGVSKKKLVYKINSDFLKLLLSIIVYYSILIVSRKSQELEVVQLVSLVPLVTTVFYFYKVANSEILICIYKSKRIGLVMQIISGLCLEIYLVQSEILTDYFNNIFPLNLIVMFIIIVISAYILRCFARIFSQTFMEKQFDWKLVFQIQQ